MFSDAVQLLTFAENWDNNSVADKKRERVLFMDYCRVT